MVESRKQGDREGEGVTRKTILGYILASPGGIEEADIRKRLFEERQIKETRGIINHLKKLEETKLIKKRKERIKQKGIRNIWKINNDFKNHEEFYEAIKFVSTQFNNRSINNFLRINQLLINEEFLNFLGISITDNDVRDKVLLMLRYSPTVFNELIFKIIPYIKNNYENTGDYNTRMHIGNDVKKYINILEIMFFRDNSSLPIPHIKKSDFQKFEEAFKLKKESAGVDFYDYSHEITQKIRIIYYPDQQEVQIMLELPLVFSAAP
jgi:Txe/YoeB family toxin of Txe-Axe toxin-antitoxin module